MIKIIWLLATVYFMSRLVKKLLSSMQEIKREEDFDAGDAVVDVEAERRSWGPLVDGIHSLPGDRAAITDVKASGSNLCAGCVGHGCSLRNFRHQSIDRYLFINTFCSRRLTVCESICS